MRAIAARVVDRRARDRRVRLRGRPYPRHLAAPGSLPPRQHQNPALQRPLWLPVRKRLPGPATERRTGRLRRGAPAESEAHYRGEGQGAHGLRSRTRSRTAREGGALERAVDGPGLESEQVLRLTIEGGRSVIDDKRSGSLAAFEAALARALPRAASSRTCIPGKRATRACGSALITSAPWLSCGTTCVLESVTFEDALNGSLPDGTQDQRRPRHLPRVLCADHDAVREADAAPAREAGRSVRGAGCGVARTRRAVGRPLLLFNEWCRC